MGEMAEYMLNGDDCSGCGEYLGEGDGFARLCSSCQADNRAENDLFVINDKADVKSLGEWLSNIEFNSFKKGLRDRHYKPMIGLRNKSNDNFEKKGLILCVNADLYNMSLDLVKKAQGGKADE